MFIFSLCLLIMCFFFLVSRNNVRYFPRTRTRYKQIQWEPLTKFLNCLNFIKQTYTEHRLLHFYYYSFGLTNNKSNFISHTYSNHWNGTGKRNRKKCITSLNDFSNNFHILEKYLCNSTDQIFSVFNWLFLVYLQ